MVIIAVGAVLTLLAVVGGALGLGAAYWTLRAVIAWLPASSGMQFALTPSLDPRVLLFCIGLSLASGLAFGLFPALQSTRPDLVPALKSQSGGRFLSFSFGPV